MWETVKSIVFVNVLCVVLGKIDEKFINQQTITTKIYAIWENATVPFYVNSDHFDHEQTTEILTALSMFAFKTCIKFMPVMAPPTTEDVLVFQNPDAVRRCVINTHGHSVFKPHVLDLGYDCLKSPQIDMMIMKSLGFPFEHNRISRDNYIEVLHENIEPGALELFTKEDTLPMELRFLQYDINSVMHFDQREYSRNGHRTIIFKDPNAKQNRVGLTLTDLKKIEIVYGPQCRARDRQEKIELCQSYPGVARRKREVDGDAVRTKRQVNEKEFANKSLRVNPDITVPPTLETGDDFKDLNVDDEMQQIIETVYKISAAALKNAKEKYCNGTKPVEQDKSSKISEMPASDVLRIVETVKEYARDMVNIAVKNLTEFCLESETKLYQRSICDWRNPRSCPTIHKSTKSGLPKYSTQHRPHYYMSTKNYGNREKVVHYGRSGNDTVDLKAEKRKKRDVDNITVSIDQTKTTSKIKEIVTEKVTEGKDKVLEDKEKLSEGKGVAEKKTPKSNQNGRRAIKHKNRAAFYAGYDSIEEPKQREEIIAKKEKREHYSDEKEFRRPVKDAKMEIRRPEVVRPDKHPKLIRKPVKNSNEVDEEFTDVNDSIETEPRRPKVTRRPVTVKVKRFSTPVKKRQRPRDIKRPRDVEPKWPREKEQRKRPRELRKPTTRGSIEREQLVEITDERETEGSRIKTLKKPRQKKRPDYNVEDDEEAEVPEKSKMSYSEPEDESELPKTVELSKANLEFYKERMWPDRTVWYMIKDDPNYNIEDMRRRLEEVNQILKKRTCVKLVEITPRQANKYEDYIVIDNSPDYVTGRVGGKQSFGAIELFRGDQHRQHTAMIVMAMLGFYFEVSRHDRDKYVRVHMRHVRPDKLHHFELIRSDATLPLPYDYASATHPAWQFWRQLGHSGISTVATFKEIDPDGTIMKSLGQNEKLLSETDIVKINSVYGIKCFRKQQSRVKDSLRTTNDSLAVPAA